MLLELLVVVKMCILIGLEKIDIIQSPKRK